MLSPASRLDEVEVGDGSLATELELCRVTMTWEILRLIDCGSIPAFSSAVAYNTNIT